jgi:iron only hydrogenase large subunit-like protein
MACPSGCTNGGG